MTGQQAGEVVAILLAAFPDLALEREAFQFWTSMIAELEDHELALDVARGVARNQQDRPTIAGFREQYLSAAKRKRDAEARERGLPEPGPQGVPEDVREWMATHQIGRPV